MIDLSLFESALHADPEMADVVHSIDLDGNGMLTNSEIKAMTPTQSEALGKALVNGVGNARAEASLIRDISTVNGKFTDPVTGITKSMELGGGGRFNLLTREIQYSNVKDGEPMAEARAKAIAATIGRAKYGTIKYNAM